MHKEHELGEMVQDRDPVWTAWTNAMDAVHVGDVDTAFAEVLSTGDDLLLVKLMDRTGTVIDQLSSEVGTASRFFFVFYSFDFYNYLKV